MEQGYFALKATYFIDLLGTSWKKLKLDNADAGTQGPRGICWSSIPCLSLLSLSTKAGWTYALRPFVLVIRRITVSRSPEPPSLCLVAI